MLTRLPQPEFPGKLVFIVEDDEGVRRMLVRTLQTLCCVEAVGDGTSALNRLAHPPIPSAIILDVCVPGLDGFTLAKKIKATLELQVVPIIFLTSRTEVADVIEGIQAGARHYVQKPFKVQDLLAKVRKLLRNPLP